MCCFAAFFSIAFCHTVNHFEPKMCQTSLDQYWIQVNFGVKFGSSLGWIRVEFRLSLVRVRVLHFLIINDPIVLVHTSSKNITYVGEANKSQFSTMLQLFGQIFKGKIIYYNLHNAIWCCIVGDSDKSQNDISDCKFFFKHWMVL